MRNPLDLTGKRVLVTGASSGIGRAVAITLSQLGARLVLVGRREDALLSALAELDEPNRHLAQSFDLRETDAVAPWVKSLAGQGGAFDGCVHAAGLSTAIPVRILSRSRMDDLMVINVYASLALVRGISAKGVGNEGASLVFISSVSGLAGALGHSVYSASKGALHAMVRSAAKELGGRRMRVNCIAPAWVRGPIMDVVSNIQGDAAFEKVQERQFLGGIAPEDVAAAAAYLVSDVTRTMTGTTLVIDGGWTC